MIDLTCEICTDLIPLVRDGAASEESRLAVERHVRTCPACRALYGGDPVPAAEPDPLRALQRLRRQSRSFMLVLLAFGVFLGMGMTGQGIFYNSLLMPVVGILGYCVMRWHALYAVPGMLLLSGLMMSLPFFQPSPDLVEPGYSLVWAAIFAGFASAGALAAGLAHFAFKKEE